MKMKLKFWVLSSSFLSLAIIVTGIVLYNYFWGIIVTDRIFSSLSVTDGATVWDMGAFYAALWDVLHIHTFAVFLDYLNKPIVFLLSPLALIDNPFFFVHLQTFWISVTALPLYMISKHITKNEKVSVLLSISYLLFFGIAGQNWFDLHFQTLFVPLFTMGYLLHLKGYRKASLLFILLSGTVHFGYMIFPLLFFLLLFLEELAKMGRRNIRSITYIGAGLSIILLLIGYFSFMYQSVPSSSFASNAVHVTSLNLFTNLSSNIDNEIFTFFLLLSPFLMLPLLSRKWVIYMVPYFALVFLSGNGNYFFPGVIGLQYFSLIVPFLYLGTIDVISRIDSSGFLTGISLTNKEESSSSKDSSNSHRFWDTIYKNRKTRSYSQLKIVLIIFAIIILLSSVYEPYGPLNTHTSSDFNLNEVLSYNQSLYDNYSKIVNLIPANDPYILYQNNMPQVLYRDPSALTIYLFGEPYNYTYFINGKWTSNISYIITDPYSVYFTRTGSYPDSSSMYLTLYHFLSTGEYGILAEYAGIILLKKGYTGDPVIYGGEYHNFNSSELYSGLTLRPGNSTYISSSNLSNGQTLWYGPYYFLQPGKYEVTLQVNASNISKQNSFVIRYSYILNTTQGPIDKELINVNGNNLSAANTWVNLSFDVDATNFYNYVEFAGQNFHWNGNFSIRSIAVKQLSWLD